MDRGAEMWSAELGKLKAAAGECETASDIRPTGALSGTFNWRCTHGRVRGAILLSPESLPRIQKLDLSLITP
jgi:hypothetical protein